MPTIVHHFDEATLAREAATKAHVVGVFETLAKASHGRIVNTSEGDYLDHPGGGCRMGADPATSVCDSHGRTHDHENLFVVGAPTTPDRRMHERHVDVRGADAAVGGTNRADLARKLQPSGIAG